MNKENSGGEERTSSRGIKDAAARALAAVKGGAAVLADFWRDTVGRIALAGSEAPLGMLRGLGFCALAFLLGRAVTLFGATPLGIALLSAASAYIPFILLGLIGGALTLEGGGVMIAVYIAAVGLRLIARAVIDPPREGSRSSRPFAEGLYLRMSTAAVSAFAVGLYRIIAGGFYFYDLWGAIFAMSVAPVAVIVYSSLFGEVEIAPERESSRGVRFYAICYYAVLFSITLSLRSVSFFGFSAVHAAACGCTLFALRQRGRLGALTAGALCGLAAGLAYAPLYAVAGLAASALIAVSPLVAATAVLACGTVFSLFFGTVQDFVSIFPAQLVGLCAFCAWGMISQRLSVCTEAQAAAPTGEDELRSRLKALSEGYAELARDFSRLAEYGRYPSFGELRAACDRACDACCTDCENRKLCWELEYSSTVKHINSICRGGVSGEAPSVDMLPEYLRRRCERLPQMMGFIADEYRAMLGRGKGGELSAFAAEYKVISGVLETAIDESAAENAYLEEESEAVRRVMRHFGVGFSTLAVRGTRRKRISAEGVDLSRASCRMGELRTSLEEAVGCALAPPTLVPLSPHGASVEFKARRRFSVSYGAARSAADGDGSCGDRVCRAEREDGMVYALLCDGMGTGFDASMASGKCGLFLRRMLAAGMSAPSALEAVNTVLRAGNGECSVSLDLLAIDTVSGEASLYKSGAAPTYLRRDGKVFPIDAPGVPMGILAEPELTRSDFTLRAGDLIVLSSDGVDADGSVAGGRSVWLFDLIESEFPVGEMANRAVRAARQAGSRDDISVIVLKINEEAE